jgi:hypothetical protein
MIRLHLTRSPLKKMGDSENIFGNTALISTPIDPLTPDSQLQLLELNYHKVTIPPLHDSSVPSWALDFILSSVGPHTVIDCLNFALIKPIRSPGRDEHVALERIA